MIEHSEIVHQWINSTGLHESFVEKKLNSSLISPNAQSRNGKGYLNKIKKYQQQRKSQMSSIRRTKLDNFVNDKEIVNINTDNLKSLTLENSIFEKTMLSTEQTGRIHYDDTLSNSNTDEKRNSRNLTIIHSPKALINSIEIRESFKSAYSKTRSRMDDNNKKPQRNVEWNDISVNSSILKQKDGKDIQGKLGRMTSALQ